MPKSSQTSTQPVSSKTGLPRVGRLPVGPLDERQYLSSVKRRSNDREGTAAENIRDVFSSLGQRDDQFAGARPVMQRLMNERSVPVRQREAAQYNVRFGMRLQEAARPYVIPREQQLGPRVTKRILQCLLMLRVHHRQRGYRGHGPSVSFW